MKTTKTVKEEYEYGNYRFSVKYKNGQFEKVYITEKGTFGNCVGFYNKEELKELQELIPEILNKI